MNLKKSALLVLLVLLLGCRSERNKVVWTHVDEDLDKLLGDVRQITITSDRPVAKNFYYVININKQGKETELTMHFHDVQLKTRYVSKYEKNDNTENFLGFLSTSKNNQGLNNETMSGIYKYDTKGQIIKLVKMGGVENGNICNYKYNKFGDLIESDEYSNGQIQSKERFKYDSRHLVTELLTEFDDSSKEKLTYLYKKFDPMNNWITKVVLSDGRLSTTITRKITYY